MNYLAQYGVRRASYNGSIYVVDWDPGSFNIGDVSNFIIKQIDNDQLPEPDDDWPIVFGVIMPTNSSFQGDSRVETVPLSPGVVSQITGQNSSLTWADYDLGDVDNDPAYFFWTGNNGTLDYVTTVLSHELVEIATDPNGGNGIRQVGCAANSGGCQIGDVCGSWCDNVRGVRAQAYWSQTDGKCVLPTMYSLRQVLTGNNINGRVGSLGSPIPSLNALVTSLL